MRTFSRVAILLLALAVLTSLTGLSLAQGGEAQVRFVHVLPGTGAVDIYVDDVPAVRTLSFGEASTYVALPSSEHQITVTESGASTPLWEQSFAPAAGSSLALIVSNADSLQFTVFPEDTSALPLGKARITAVNAISDAPAVDVVLEDGRAVIPGLSYNAPYGTLDVPALVYPFAVVPSGGSLSEALVPATPFALNSGTSYTIVVYGSVAAPETLVLATSTAPETISGFARLVHGVEGVPAVDVYLDDVLTVPGLAYGEGTDFIAIPEGDYNVTLRAAGTTDILASGDLSIGENDYLTTAALADGNDVSIQTFADNAALVDAFTPAFTLFNGLLDGDDLAVTLQSADGATAADALEVAPGEAGTAVFPPTSSGLNATISAGAAADNVTTPVVYGGVYYSALAVAGADGFELLSLAPVSLAQTLGSAPGNTLPPVVPPTLPPPTEVAQVATATPVAPAAPTNDPNVVLPTTAPAATTAPTGPTARIILNPDANLQLRQYPSSSALSLGLAPSGTILVVNGRQGAPAFIEGVATPTLAPEATEFVDPATLLAEDEDLDPTTTWLNVVYSTPDGGEIEAWVNAQFLDVRDDRGRRQRLADLPTVPENQPGEARDTAVTPPPVPENIVFATVFNLDQGVNLQIRRTPDRSGESLALVPNDTSMELVGVNEAGDWAFIRYNPPEGGSVTGWVSMSFVQLSYRNRSVDLEDLETLELLTIVPDTQRGALGVGASGPATPTVDPLRDVVVGTVTLTEGANLHLRRTPNISSESLALMPNGTQLLVTGRSGTSSTDFSGADTGEWVRVEFEGQVGWTSSQYLVLTFNGAPYNLADVPLVDLVVATPTATPEA